jgi:adenine-specific DNA-methyltransferase
MDRDNLIIKGNNLLALHSLFPRFRGRVKLIYIDPPYNTGSGSFGYNDQFNHSTWLTFMKNRLEAARGLLRNDGVILIQIDNRELAYLKVLCDEIFGRDNFRNAIIVKKGTKSLQKQFETIQQLYAGYDTILLYSKKANTRIPNLFKKLGKLSSSWNNHWRGTDRPTMRFQLFGITPETGQWRWSKERTCRAVENYQTLIEFIRPDDVAKEQVDNSIIDAYYHKYIQQEGILDHKDFELVRLSERGKPEHYIPARTEILLSENWMDLSVAGRVTDFEHEKNEEILQRILEWLTVKDDIVLDFFLGSGTTAAVAHKLGRQYIGIEQLDYGENDSIIRLKNVIAGEQDGIAKAVGWQGGGSVVVCELMQWNACYIDQIQAAQSADELVALWEKMQERAFLSYKVDLDQFDEHADEFAQLSLADQKRFLCQALDKNQLYVNLSEIEDADYQVSEQDKRLNWQFYSM